MLRVMSPNGANANRLINATKSLSTVLQSVITRLRSDRTQPNRCASESSLESADDFLHQCLFSDFSSSASSSSPPPLHQIHIHQMRCFRSSSKCDHYLLLPKIETTRLARNGNISILMTMSAFPSNIVMKANKRMGLERCLMSVREAKE